MLGNFTNRRTHNDQAFSSYLYLSPFRLRRCSCSDCGDGGHYPRGRSRNRSPGRSLGRPAMKGTATCNAGILTARKPPKPKKRSKLPIVVLVLLCFSFAGGWTAHKPETIIQERIVTVKEQVPVYQPLKTKHSKKYVNDQVDYLAAAIPERALKPLRKPKDKIAELIAQTR